MRTVTFGPYRLNLDTGELSRSDVPVKLQPQPAKLLVLLVERAGELVTRDEIRRGVWGTETFVDFAPERELLCPPDSNRAAR